MAVSVVMPALEMAQETGKLIAWRKKEGDRVHKGETLLEIETDKAVVEVEAQADGILASVSAREGARIPVGQTIAWLVQPGERAPIRDAADARSVASADIRVSPKARRLAQEHNVNLATLQGSGPDGEIVAEDVLAAGRTDRADAAAEQAVRPRVGASSVARLMAERTTAGWTTVPHFFVSRDVDAGALMAARDRAAGVSHTDVLVSSVACALAKHPQMNASWIENRVRVNSDVNVAIAIAVEDAVVAGVIHGADARSLTDIASRRTELASRARAGRLQPADIAGATFTISNLGMFHVDAFTAIIVPPQAGILAVGAIRDRVAVFNGQAAVRPMMTLTLSCDHRVVDGARAAQFLDDVVCALDQRR